MSDETCVPLVRTTISNALFADAVRTAWPEATREAIGTLWAQYAFETGRGKACWNNNIGNVKHVQGDGHDFTMLPGTWEMIAGKRVTFEPPHPQTWFRSYPTLAEGMAEHIAFLRRRYGAAWRFVESGDPASFALALKAGGYFTGDAGIYSRSLVSLLAEWLRDPSTKGPVDTLLPSSEAAPTQPELPDDDVPDTQPSGELVGPQGSAVGIAEWAASEMDRLRREG